jgi:alpha-beta hydrolase superfamily lysophospholipase
VQHQEGTFQGVRDLTLYYQCWLPQQEKASLILLHGLGGHSGHFEKVARNLVERGYGIYGFDLRGHGRSPGQRGFIQSWAEFRGDLRRFIHRVQEQKREIPCFLGGQSLGGLIALDYAFRCPAGLHGLIISGIPMGRVSVPAVKMTIGRVLSRVYPQFSLSTGLDGDACTRDPSVAEFYLNDPLCHDQGTARLATEYLKTVRWLQKHPGELHLPLLLLHGDADRIAPVADSEMLFEKITSPSKHKRIYVGGYHSVYDGINYAEVVSDLGNWMEQHLHAPVYSSAVLLSSSDSEKQPTMAEAMRSLVCQISLDGLEIA